MNRESRIRYILKSVERGGSPSVRDLVTHLGVSHMTVHRDLEFLEREGLLIRRHGYAVQTEALSTLFSFSHQLEQHQAEKKAICAQAAELLHAGDTLFIDHGSTLFFMSESLRQVEPLRVITNSLPIAVELMPQRGVQVVLTGGELFNDRKACYGSLTEKALRTLRADKAFVGADGISLEGGVSSYDEKLGEVIRIMVKNATRTYLLVDSSKLERTAYHPIMSLSEVDGLITDEGMPESLRRRYRAAGVKLSIAKVKKRHSKRAT